MFSNAQENKICKRTNCIKTIQMSKWCKLFSKGKQYYRETDIFSNRQENTIRKRMYKPQKTSEIH